MKIGFVSVRFAGLDGVSLEAAKLAEVVREVGHEVVWFAGELGTGFQPGTENAAARFDSPENLEIQQQCFGVSRTSPDVGETIRHRAAALRSALEEFVSSHDVDVLVPQNALSIPMQLPLGVALAEMATSGFPTVAHHHDFWWERERFSQTGVAEILSAAFPPLAANLRHMVINSITQTELEARTGEVATVLPNVMDFEHEPQPGNGSRFRQYVGVAETDTVFLQATRIIPRKTIEFTLELAAALDDPTIKVVISHPERDEGDEYATNLARRAAELNVDLRFTSTGAPGAPSLADAYAAADLVTYPSRIEGFGNALLEAVFYRRPMLVNRYPVYVSDIAPTGLKFVEIDGAITTDTIAEVGRWLGDTSVWEAVVDANYAICRKHFSYAVVRDRFVPLLDFQP